MVSRLLRRHPAQPQVLAQTATRSTAGAPLADPDPGALHRSRRSPGPRCTAARTTHRIGAPRCPSQHPARCRGHPRVLGPQPLQPSIPDPRSERIAPPAVPPLSPCSRDIARCHGRSSYSGTTEGSSRDQQNCLLFIAALHVQHQALTQRRSLDHLLAQALLVNVGPGLLLPLLPACQGVEFAAAGLDAFGEVFCSVATLRRNPPATLSITHILTGLRSRPRVRCRQDGRVPAKGQ